MESIFVFPGSKTETATARTLGITTHLEPPTSPLSHRCPPNPMSQELRRPNQYAQMIIFNGFQAHLFTIDAGQHC